MVLGDLPRLLVLHRACHRFDLAPGASTPSTKASSEHLDWLAAHREHPLLDGDRHAALRANLPALVLGFTPRAIAGFVVFRGMWAIFVHSNVRLPLGPLRVLLGAPGSCTAGTTQRVDRTRHNFANLAPWIDVLFRTHHCPEGEEIPIRSRHRRAVAEKALCRAAPLVRSLHRGSLALVKRGGIGQRNGPFAGGTPSTMRRSSGCFAASSATSTSPRSSA